MKPIVSIGLIVKNEIRCIERCLKALQPLRDAVPCELVIADTGSTDGTREIAQKYADICFDFEWIDDFSAARNAVMDRCSGKWFFSIDADEYLDDNIDMLKQFFLSPHKKFMILLLLRYVAIPTRVWMTIIVIFPQPELLECHMGHAILVAFMRHGSLTKMPVVFFYVKPYCTTMGMPFFQKNTQDKRKREISFCLKRS